MTFSTLLGGTLSWLTLAGQIIFVLLIISFIFAKKGNWLTRIVKKNGMAFSLVIALIALLGSLSYSDILGLEPCKLCWFQRITMYPQVIILGLGLYIKDKNACVYAAVLSAFGALFAWYHYLEQIGFVPATCESVGGYSVSCSKVFSMHMGYITIPLMAFTAFMLNIIILVMYRSARKQ